MITMKVGDIMPDELTNSKLYLFLYTMKEYQRFSGGRCSHELTAGYDAEAYVRINTKLILLRKYGSKGEPVFIILADIHMVSARII